MNLQIMPTGDGKNAGYEWHRFMKTEQDNAFNTGKINVSAWQKM